MDSTAVIRSALPGQARGDFDWQAIYDAHWSWVFKLARTVGGRWVDPEDVTQDVFVAVAQKINAFEGRSTLKTWIYRITFNIASEHRRRAQRQRKLIDALSRVAFWRSPPTPEQSADAHRALAHVQVILEEMDEAKRQVFVLREIEELSGEEVADVLGIPPATVRTRLHHARRQFAKILFRHQRGGAS